MEHTELTFDLSSEPVYIIGGGPSLDGFDMAGLQGTKIGTNRSAFHSDSAYMVSVDKAFVKHHRNEIITYMATGSPVILVIDDRDHEAIPGAIYVHRHRGPRLSNRNTHLACIHSGLAALNFAYIAGATDIRLLGFDMRWKDGKSHYHDGYEWQNSETERYQKKWVTAMLPIADQLCHEDVTVTNYVGDPESRLTAFDKKPLSELS